MRIICHRAADFPPEDLGKLRRALAVHVASGAERMGWHFAATAYTEALQQNHWLMCALEQKSRQEWPVGVLAYNVFDRDEVLPDGGGVLPQGSIIVWRMGVRYPRRGIGTRMLRYVLETAAAQGVGCFLPGATEGSRGLADRLGFRAARASSFIFGYPRYALPEDLPRLLARKQGANRVPGPERVSAR